VIAANWDNWSEAGMAADAAASMQSAHLRTLGKLGITNREAEQVFERLLHAPVSQVAVTTRHLPAWIRNVRSMYRDLDATWNTRAADLNERLRAAELPIRVANLSTIWTIVYLVPSRYNWMLQFYLRIHGISLSWVGTGRLIFSLNFTEADFASAADRIVDAARAMHAGGWWSTGSVRTNRSIRRRVLQEMLQVKFLGALRNPKPSRTR